MSKRGNVIKDVNYLYCVRNIFLLILLVLYKRGNLKLYKR